MEKVAITGLTWMEVMAKFKENGEMDSAKVDFNGSELDHLIANQFVKPDGNSDTFQRVKGLYKVSLLIEPVEEGLTVNGEQIPFDID